MGNRPASAPPRTLKINGATANEKKRMLPTQADKATR